VHGAYCNVFRQTINLVPGDVAVACFKEVESLGAGQRGLTIGALDPGNGQVVPGSRRLPEDRRAARSAPLSGQPAHVIPP
jgi:hypothetical protein